MSSSASEMSYRKRYGLSLICENAIHDVKITTVWHWTDIFVLGFTAALRQNKMTYQSIIHKRNVLITNGFSSLSQALCEQLIDTHKCRVALLSSVNEQKDVTRRHESISLFDCNLLNRQQVSEVASKLEKQFGTIELVIHQESGIGLGSTEEQTEQFVSQTSNDILGFVNLLTCFVPCMLQQDKGRIVSIKNTPSNVKAALDCQQDYDDLVQSIFRSQTASFPNHSIRGPENIRFTTVFSNHQQQQHTKLTPNLILTEHEIAQRILRGIESGQTYVQIQARRNLLEFCSANIAQLASIGLDKLQLRKSQKIPIKVQ